MRNTILIILSLIIVVASVFYTNHLANELGQEEQQKVEIWAEATRQFIIADPETDISFVSTIIEGNTTIPVYMTDSEGRYLMSRNVSLPKRLQKEGMAEESIRYYQQQVDELKDKVEPIEVRVEPDILQYIYYDESKLLKRLHYFPYIQFLIIVIFFLVAIVSISASHRAEENRVWVGLCKETAHQLGTPISSLNAWNELHRAQYPDDSSFAEEDNDIRRLSTITDRFSKVGSRPTLSENQLYPILQSSIQYMATRTSQRVEYSLEADESAQQACSLLNSPLFTWVIENLLRNAVDAMEGNGKIRVLMQQHGDNIHIDICDSGKGIERHLFRRVFRPGYTTKTRGWGLGLSLSKRIVKDYHHGKIFVLSSVVAPQEGHGTTFRIVLKKA